MSNDLGVAGRPVLAASIADQLHDVLRHRITTGVMAPGSRIDSGAIAAEFGVSKTPIRDALIKLEHERLVETRPRSGSFVVRPTRQDVHEVCQLRKGLEWLATGIAAQKMSTAQIADLRAQAVAALEAAEAGDFEPFFESDTRLHREIIEFTGNSRLIASRSSVEPFVYWLRVLGATGANRIAGSTARHLKILDAMAERDVAAAQSHAATHLDEIEEWTLDDMSSRLIAT
ncbi:GntR family transcriptional regulator [Aeromicrobium camelliae]|uniref:GntR family transcriptional regulator n=2 Tax=Aeromicrobium camelliae TaxID=1538144 RepID=A0A3N6X5G6_9ACTN|nr:GntR family transcriptional regulator [Aeromicrobium camelliae]RQN08893.1 GntR family transcriptional regulator [Aeromicrobium camelliae]